MSTTLFHFVSIRGTSVPKVTTQDLALVPKETLTSLLNFKSACELSETEARLIDTYNYLWVRPKENLPSVWHQLDTSEIAHLRFCDIDQNDTGLILSKTDYINSVKDLEAILYKKLRNADDPFLRDELAIRKLKFIVLINGYYYKKEIRIKITGTMTIGDVLITLPIMVLIGRKHNQKAIKQIDTSTLKKGDLYKDDKKLLSEISTGKNHEYSISAVISALCEDIITLENVINRLLEDFNEKKRAKIEAYHLAFSLMNPGKPDVPKRLFPTFFGELIIVQTKLTNRHL
jgi:hypothetical protein